MEIAEACAAQILCHIPVFGSKQPHVPVFGFNTAMKIASKSDF